MADALEEIGSASNRSRAAVVWFRNQILRAMGRPVPSSVASGVKTRPDIVRKVARTIGTESIGSMYAYVYDPKYKETLPYYDVYPIIFVIGAYPDGWLGINLHYLAPELRSKLMIELLSITKTDTRMDLKTRLNLSYRYLNGAARFRYFKPCVKRYLRRHVQSQMIMIPAAEWSMAAALPLQRFMKAPDSTVWDQSRIKAGG